MLLLDRDSGWENLNKNAWSWVMLRTELKAIAGKMFAAIAFCV
ncbi:MAG: hypothetical protein ACRC8Y_11665 [Chroococcales cyanobacterium]